MEKLTKYSEYDVQHFIADPIFREWVLNPTPKLEMFWKQIIFNYPEKELIIRQASKLLVSIHFLEEYPPTRQVEDSLKKTISAITNKRNSTPVISIFRRWSTVAASVVVLISISFFFFQNRNTEQMATVLPSKEIMNDFAPGGNRAILTLGNGETIILDSAENGALSTQGGTAVLKLADGKIAYEGSHENNSKKIVYNTISTPTGGQYNLTLSDGSKVWLNAESSLKFPASFAGEDRMVELIGEGYFEIAHNEEKPFHVSVNNAIVEVLGTHFNINAYSNENSLKTTLLEGSIKVIKGSQNVIIEPGQQVVINNASNSININKLVNLEEAVAWKNGLFQFNNLDMQEVMNQLGRWYGMNVIFDEDAPLKRITGKIYRNKNASEVFKVLEKLDVHFKLEGNTVIIKK